MHTLNRETSSLAKAAGIMVGACLFGLFGPLLFMHVLRWFEMNLPGAVMIGVLVGGLVGYCVAEGAVRLYQHEATSQHGRPMVISPHLGANLRA
jgi:hypothetical protein